MNKWTAEQRNQIILLAIGTAGVAVLIWFGLIGSLQASIQAQRNKIALGESKVKLTKAGISKEEQFKEEIETGQRQLLELEGKMPQGDIYRWVINSLLEIESGHDVNIVESGPPQNVELNIPPKVPYRAVSYSIAGTGYYRSFGLFVAELENSSPFIRLKGLTLQSVAPGLASPATSERLTFRLEFVTLVKSAPSGP